MTSHATVGQFRALDEHTLPLTLGLHLPVLMYHRVAPDVGGRWPHLTVSPKQFEFQLGWLKRHGYKTVVPGDLERYRSGAAPFPRKAVMLTFDDAHETLAQYAFPLLCEYGFRAAVFVVTACVGQTNRWDAAAGWGPFPLMGPGDIRLWTSRGVEFGAHSRTHPDLTRLSLDKLESEIAGSRTDLEDLLGTRVVAFSYPFGYCNHNALAMVKRHYSLAFLADGGLNTPRTDPHQMRRVMVQSRDGRLALRLLFSTGWTPNTFWDALRKRRSAPANL